MKVQINDMVRRVYALLNENESIIEERVEYGDPDAMIRPLIIDLLPDAARAVLLEMPLDRINGCRKLDNIAVENDGIRNILLPSDFLRLVYVRLAGVREGIATPLAFGGGEYQLRVASDGSASRRRSTPAVAVRNCGDEKRLEIFGWPQTQRVEKLLYVPLPEMTPFTIELPPGAISDVCRRTAEMVSEVIG